MKQTPAQREKAKAEKIESEFNVLLNEYKAIATDAEYTALCAELIAIMDKKAGY